MKKIILVGLLVSLIILVKKQQAPELIEKSAEEIDAIIAFVQTLECADHWKSFIINCIRGATWLPNILRRKDVTLFRLREMIFGQGWSKRRKKKKSHHGNNDGGNSSEPNQTRSIEENSTEIDDEGNTTDMSRSDNRQKNHSKGHGRNGHNAYECFEEERIQVEDYCPKDLCPQGCGGRLYVFKPENPGIVVRITGQDFLKVKKYYLQALRCNVCAYYIKAKLPEGISNEKYDNKFRALLGLYKFELAVPYQRLERFQTMMGNPLPDSTQWDEVEKLANCCFKPFDLIQYCAANGNFIHNDDTGVKILAVMKALDDADNPKRTGMFTTGIVGEYDNHPIALYFNGTMHAGENLSEVLKKRDKTFPPIIQMCDALSRNIPTDIETLLCHCLTHGFRKFRDLLDFFPEQCQSILHELGKVYEFDSQTQSMTDEERLAYHQKHSAPVMHALYDEMNQYIDDKVVEPNDECGEAIRYMLKHWIPLTQFLKVPGAPLDNTIVERALKMVIRVRKNSLFYRTTYSANLSGMITSLIETCKLNKVNPVDYFIAIQDYKALVDKQPDDWLPWTFSETLARLKAPITTTATANLDPRPPPPVNPAATTPAIVPRE